MVYGQNISATTEENFLEGVNGVDVIPGYAAFDEMVFHVAEASEADFNAMMMQIGVQELAFLEENKTEMIYEEGKVKGMVDKVIKFFQDMWEKLKGMFNKALDTINTKTMEWRRKMFDKLGGDAKSFMQKRVSNLKADAKFGSSYKDLLESADLSKKPNEIITKINSKDADIENAYTDAAVAEKNGNSADTNALDDKLKGYVNEVIHSVASADVSNISTIVKHMKDKLHGQRFDVDGAWVKSHWDHIWTEATEFPQTKRDIKSTYKAAEKSYNNAIKACKKADNSKIFSASAYSKAVKAYKDLRQICSACCQAQVSCLNERQSFFRSIVMKVAVSKPVKEAAVSESTTVDGIDSLFAW